MKENTLHLASFNLTYFFIFAAVASLFPFYPLVLQQKGFSPPQIGYIMGSYDLFSIAGLLILGHFYDKLRSPRRTIAAIGGLCILTLLLISLTESMLPVIPLTICLGFLIKSPPSLVDALYGQTMKHPHESYGKARLSGSLGFFCSAGLIQLTGWVRGSSPETVFAGYAICMGTALVMIAGLPTEHLHTREGDQPHSSFLKTIRAFPGVYWIGLAIAFLSSMGMSGHYTFFSLLLKNRFGTEEVGGFWAIGPLFEIPLFFFSGYLLKKFRLSRLWLVCLAAGIIRMQVYSRAGSLLPLYLVQVLHSLSFGLNHLCMMTLITRVTPPGSRGLAISLYTAIGMGLSMFTGGILGGAILTFSGFHLLFQIFSLFPLAAMGISLFLLKEPKKDASTAVPGNG